MHALDAAAWDQRATFPSVIERLASEPFFGPGHDTETTLVAELDGVVAGYVRLRAPTPLPESSHVRQVTGIAVASFARGRGVARSLLAAAAEQARAERATRLTLRVLATNGVARRLYHRAGFVEEGVLRGEFRIDGLDVDDHLLALRLDTGGAAPVSRPGG